ncbi:SAF domain-containing protein [Campylobacter jejuni]|nr:SAF domain-containing protein [Campylobacter jejuni]
MFSEENVKSVRPSFGLHPKFYQELLGKKASKDIEFGDALKESDFR